MHGFVSPGQHVDTFYNNEEDSAEGKEESDLTGAETSPLREVKPYVVR